MPETARDVADVTTDPATAAIGVFTLLRLRPKGGA